MSGYKLVLEIAIGDPIARGSLHGPDGEEVARYVEWSHDAIVKRACNTLLACRRPDDASALQRHWNALQRGGAS